MNIDDLEVTAGEEEAFDAMQGKTVYSIGQDMINGTWNLYKNLECVTYKGTINELSQYVTDHNIKLWE